jgi:hypothetical protein
MNATIYGKIAMLAAFAAFLFGAGPLGSSAYAQGGDVIRCESQDNNPRECQYYGDGRVRLMRQLSVTNCVEGSTWGVDERRRVLWVAYGCRGEFLVDLGRGGDRFGGRDDGYPPRVTPLRNGESEVAFQSGCVITFDSRGRRISTRRGCSNDEIRRSEMAVRERSNDNDFDRRPEVNIGRNGDGEVYFRDNNCVVNYNPRGNRTSSRQNCSGNQLRIADQAMADYRRGQRF